MKNFSEGYRPENHPRAMRWLKEHDVLNADGKFHVPMVERWVRERA